MESVTAMILNSSLLLISKLGHAVRERVVKTLLVEGRKILRKLLPDDFSLELESCSDQPSFWGPRFGKELDLQWDLKFV